MKPMGKLSRSNEARWVVTPSGDLGWDDGSGKPPWRLMFAFVEDGEEAPTIAPSTAQLTHLIKTAKKVDALSAALEGAVRELLGEDASNDEVLEEMVRRYSEAVAS